MIFRSSKKRDAGAAVADRGPERGAAPSRDIRQLFEEIDALTRDNRAAPNTEVEERILQLRHTAGLQLLARPQTAPGDPEPAFELLGDGSGVPETTPGELTPELLRAAVLRGGSLLVRGLIAPQDVARLVEGMDRAFDAREARRSTDGAYYHEFEPDSRFDLVAERSWVGDDAGGLWAADSPRVMVDVLDTFERAGLRDLATAYLGERPAISVNKCTLRRVRPGTGAGYDLWHQDGSFLGGDVRALNVWLSLSRCGDVAPGLDIVPRRIDHIVPTGTEGATFDWSASRAVAEEAAGEAAIQRPIFEPGDVLLFDELCLHSTAADPKMPNTRYAVESWFFGPSGFPREYAPLAF
jgi:Phytanoyl-CoA dioxygenase (PhyH)